MGGGVTSESIGRVEISWLFFAIQIPAVVRGIGRSQGIIATCLYYLDFAIYSDSSHIHAYQFQFIIAFNQLYYRFFSEPAKGSHAIFKCGFAKSIIPPLLDKGIDVSAFLSNLAGSFH